MVARHAGLVVDRHADVAVEVGGEGVEHLRQVERAVRRDQAGAVDVQERDGGLLDHLGLARVDLDRARDHLRGRARGGARGLRRRRNVAALVRAGGREPDRDRDREDGGDGDSGRGCPATLDAAGAAAYVGDGEGCVLDRVDAAVQGVVDLVLERSVVHDASPVSRGLSERGARERSPARARLAWDFTVPTEMPSTSAISASLSCS